MGWQQDYVYMIYTFFRPHMTSNTDPSRLIRADEDSTKAIVIEKQQKQLR